MAKARRWAAGKPQKVPELRAAAYQKAAKGAGRCLKPGYCLTSLFKPVENLSVTEGARQMAKVRRWAAGKPQKAPEDRALPTKTLQRPGNL